ncbi:DUF1269 domain-containing protein [Streptomyces sp. NPDC005794]|uniref:DUF1269 domain-containing protein n=1 Tax=Streptomyces sp. NPDC005794 TaxID=3364733 RepID=UPI003685BA9D
MSTLAVWKYRTADGVETASADVGIDEDFIAEVKQKVTPGTSALFLLTLDEVPSRISESLPGGGAELLHGNLDAEREAGLREVFGDEAE